MEAHSLLREFASRAAPYHGGVLLFQADDALRLINRAAEAGVPVVGIETRAADDDSPPDSATDFTGAVGEGHGCWTDAEAFVREREGSGLLFGLTLGDDPLNAA